MAAHKHRESVTWNWEAGDETPRERKARPREIIQDILEESATGGVYRERLGGSLCFDNVGAKVQTRNSLQTPSSPNRNSIGGFRAGAAKDLLSFYGNRLPPKAPGDSTSARAAEYDERRASRKSTTAPGQNDVKARQSEESGEERRLSRVNLSFSADDPFSMSGAAADLGTISEEAGADANAAGRKKKLKGKKKEAGKKTEQPDVGQVGPGGTRDLATVRAIYQQARNTLSRNRNSQLPNSQRPGTADEEMPSSLNPGAGLLLPAGAVAPNPSPCGSPDNSPKRTQSAVKSHLTEAFQSVLSATRQINFGKNLLSSFKDNKRPSVVEEPSEVPETQTKKLKCEAYTSVADELYKRRNSGNSRMIKMARKAAKEVDEIRARCSELMVSLSKLPGELASATEPAHLDDAKATTRKARLLGIAMEGAASTLLRHLKLCGVDGSTPMCSYCHVMSWISSPTDHTVNCNQCGAILGEGGNPSMWECHECFDDFHFCGDCGTAAAAEGHLSKLERLAPVHGWKQALVLASDAVMEAEARIESRMKREAALANGEEAATEPVEEAKAAQPEEEAQEAKEPAQEPLPRFPSVSRLSVPEQTLAGRRRASSVLHRQSICFGGGLGGLGMPQEESMPAIVEDPFCMRRKASRFAGQFGFETQNEKRLTNTSFKRQSQENEEPLEEQSRKQRSQDLEAEFRKQRSQDLEGQFGKQRSQDLEGQFRKQSAEDLEWQSRKQPAQDLESQIQKKNSQDQMVENILNKLGPRELAEMAGVDLQAFNENQAKIRNSLKRSLRASLEAKLQASQEGLHTNLPNSVELTQEAGKEGVSTMVSDAIVLSVPQAATASLWLSEKEQEPMPPEWSLLVTHRYKHGSGNGAPGEPRRAFRPPAEPLYAADEEEDMSERGFEEMLSNSVSHSPRCTRAHRATTPCKIEDVCRDRWEFDTEESETNARERANVERRALEALESDVIAQHFASTLRQKWVATPEMQKATRSVRAAMRDTAQRATHGLSQSIMAEKLQSGCTVQKENHFDRKIKHAILEAWDADIENANRMQLSAPSSVCTSPDFLHTLAERPSSRGQVGTTPRPASNASMLRVIHEGDIADADIGSQPESRSSSSQSEGSSEGDPAPERPQTGSPDGRQTGAMTTVETALKFWPTWTKTAGQFRISQQRDIKDFAELQPAVPVSEHLEREMRVKSPGLKVRAAKGPGNRSILNTKEWLRKVRTSKIEGERPYPDPYEVSLQSLDLAVGV